MLTAVRISSMVIWPSRFASPAKQVSTLAFPRAILTIVTISLTVTCPLLLQSPTQGIAVGDGVSVAARVAVAVADAVAPLVADGVLVDVEVGVAVQVDVGISVAVGVDIGV